MQKYIVVKGARENNLKNISLKIPKEKLVVMTGLSGSGKTSLAFDTIFKEGQRRYIESLSAYARQFLGNSEKPDVDSIEGLSPAISIDQKSTNKNPRSTIGTVTEIYDYMRLLYARIGHAYCPTHHVEIKAQTIDQMMEKIFLNEEESKVVIYSPIVFGKKGTHEKTLELIRKEGFSKIRVDGETFEVEDDIKLDKNIVHNIEIIVDRIKLRSESRSRLFNSLETALKYGEGKVVVSINDVEQTFSEHLACPYCDFSIHELEPRLFSFNSPFGACPTCKGLGVMQKLDENLLITDFDKSIREGAIRYLKNIVDTDNIEWQKFKIMMDYYNISIDKPYKDLDESEREIIMHGSKEPIPYELTTSGNNTYRRTSFIEGISDLIERRYVETTSSFSREYYSSYLVDTPCPTCHGKRLSEEALSVYVNGKNIYEFSTLTIKEALDFINKLELTETEAKIAFLILKEIKERLTFLSRVGLDYLSLDRLSATLSGGESQRIRLATQIGSHLSGVLYVLDEPSIGLHQRDNAKLIDALKEMRDLGNTLIVVEHDEEIMRQSDYLIDVGPGAGIFGGEIVACGTPSEVMENHDSITGNYLSGRMKIEVPKIRRRGNGKYIEILGACEHNLKNIDVRINEGALTVITGVSGSGKSTLVNDTLRNGLMRRIYKSKVQAGKCTDITNWRDFDRVIDIDQSPIGRTPRSNPATYTGVFDFIRDLFSETVDAKMRGYTKSRFSFNVKGGRCERCGGDGVIRIEMHFLPDVYVPCEECHGKRYNSETLEVKYRGKSISDVLEMTVDEAYEFFDAIPKISNILKTMKDVGLGYIKLGQPATTLSGGEAQRVKLASELHRKITSTALYLLDEPTTGLHSDDVKRLLEVINFIVEKGGTVIIIEHNLDVIKSADYIIDLGPEGGDAGGNIVAMGTPEEVSQVEESYTGQYLKKVL